MPQGLDTGTVVADVAILASVAYADTAVEEKTSSESESFDDDKVSVSDIEKGAGGIDLEKDILDVKGDDDDPAYAALPRIVRELCDFEDDPSIPVLTWRARGMANPDGVFPFYFVQIASLYIGKLMAAGLPSQQIGFGRFKFELSRNMSQSSSRKTASGTNVSAVLIVRSANTGATNNLGDYVLSPLAVFYNKPMNGWLAILFMWSAVFVGFSFATLARTFLIDNPTTAKDIPAHTSTSVLNAMRASFEMDSRTVRKQMRVFWLGILAFFMWEV
ncbi:hypothetical protein B0H15DRAFT_806094 [Mycena belliarum]|uniref:Uncharacterized protein n=1 Tax=Mycena belliarum TaxID=1033014 RepID=A0AAD6TUP3_9AGAR|nr:hypothetical protein B0H15DRAFT_806094 [Mycena belliae]